MAKVGDTVRYLNDVGGGKITRIEGRMAYVDDDGFENPVLLSELVVVMPAGYEASAIKKTAMFDQSAFDEGRNPAPASVEKKPALMVAKPEPVEETKHGESLNIRLAFEPSSVKQLSSSTFAAVLVNDSNYYLNFAFSRKASEERNWTLVYQGTVAPNELIDLDTLRHEEVSGYDRVALQAVAYKEGKAFPLKNPIGVVKKLNLTKFHKLHSFMESPYFDVPVIEVALFSENGEAAPEVPDVEKLKAALEGSRPAEPERKAKRSKGVDSPTKLLPLVEVDLHISELTDSIAGLGNSDMLNMQLDAVRSTMEKHKRRVGQKIVFIHGKGEGVLRKAVLDLLRHEYKYAELQDASFQEYGFGATLVTIHQQK